MPVVALALAALLPLQGAAQPATTATPQVRAELAPTGKLRMAITQVGYFVNRDAASGELSGVAIDMGRAVAAAAGVPFEPMLYQDFNKLVEGAQTGAWDLTIMGYDRARENVVAYSAPVMEIDLTLLVGPKSKVTSIEDMDRQGVVISVPRNTISDLALGRVLKHAELLRADNFAAAADAVAAGRADAYAYLRPGLVPLVAKIPGSRVLESRFDAARPALAVPQARTTAAAFVRQVVEQQRAQGAIAASIERAGVAARVAPPPQ
ncbi:transporter substrate-binding domain-containing protein [Ramlibacter albus]|uniref:Transporter substrate-binding domain-containing protein n=1 Tax=Ramlibacter albus TaxID=2079448 RepID=A0A923S2F1_9BURK|nr:transporter substrate-binding domain-containing protein [Ramlibacter albus]MBC5765276.1 transporter substrate-binding domain-containing protein [Ramlibacter albus]